MNKLFRLRGLLVIAALLWMSSMAAQAQCPGALAPWLYRVPIDLSNAGGALTNYFALVKVNTATPISQGKMRADGGDMRFADANCSPLQFWVQNGLNTSTTFIWVKIPTVAGGGTTRIWMYYGNNPASRTNAVSDVFGNGLVALYTFTEGTGATLTDWVGGFNMSVTCSWTTGFRTNVGALTGFSTGRAFVAGVGPSLNTGSFTAIDYINPTSANGSTQGIIGNYNGDGSKGWVHKLQGGAGQFMLLTNQDGNWCQTSIGSLVNNVWQMAGVRRQAGTINNGLQNGAVTGSGFCAGDNRNLDGPGPFEFGRSYNGSYAFSGSISMTLVYNVALSDGEISSLHNSIYPSTEPVLNIGAEENVTPPVITSHPSSQALCQGGTVTFTCSATGLALTYQWRKNGVAIVGATGTSYTIVNVQPVDAGQYDCVVRSQVTTNAATLTVYTPAAIQNSPVSQTICPGIPVTFSVTASGTNLTYQWRRNGTNLAGANGPQYLLPAPTLADNGSYDCVVGGLCGASVTSSAAVLNLRVPPTVMTNPADQNVCRGQIATFSVSATGEGLTYQWRFNGVPLDGATSPTLKIMAEPFRIGDYDAVITGACEPAVTTAAAHLDVTLDPIITEQPLDQTVEVGKTIIFKVKVIGGGIVSYQWQKDGVNMPGRTHDTLIVRDVNEDDIAEYNCVVRGTVCSDREQVVSNRASLILNVPPSIVKNPQDESACEGTRMTLSVTAAGLGLNYQWRKNGTNISGANDRDFTIESTVPGDAGQYDCVITGPGLPTPLITTPATVTINLPVSITTHPADVTICPGQAATFSAAAAGGNLTYRWYKDGVAIDGATSPTFTINAAQVADTGSYSVVVGGDCTDSVPSNVAHIIFNELPVITEQPTAPTDSISKNGSVTLTVKATGTSLTYQWRKDGAAIPGATTSTFTLTNAQPSDNGSYDCIVSGACNPGDTTDPVKLSVKTSGVKTFDATTGALLTVAPNPAAGITRLTIHLPQGVSAHSGAALKLFDMAGKPVMDLSTAYERSGFRSAEFNAALLPSGVYYVRVQTGEWNANLGTVVIDK